MFSTPLISCSSGAANVSETVCAFAPGYDADTITVGNLLAGLAKSPFLGLAIGLIACGQGLAAQGGAAAVGARTTSAVVLAIFGMIVISSLFTLFYVFLGI